MTSIQTSDSRDLPFPVDRVWAVVADLPGYPAWWPPSLKVKLLHREAGVLGTRIEVRPYGGQGFICEVSQMRAGERLSMRYSGIYSGSGTWTMAPVGDRCRVTYAIDLRIESRWIRLLARVLPVASIHSRLMGQMLDSLQAHLARQQASPGNPPRATG